MTCCGRRRPQFSSGGDTIPFPKSALALLSRCPCCIADYPLLYRAMVHDGQVYPEPYAFKPERFLHSCPGEDLTHVLAPLSTAWGYGRRTCAGMALGETQVWITVASIISVFDIRPAIDSMGHPIAVEPKFTSGMISCVSNSLGCSKDCTDVHQTPSPVLLCASTSPRYGCASH